MRDCLSFHSSKAAIVVVSARLMVRRRCIRGERVRPLVRSTGSVGGVEFSCFEFEPGLLISVSLSLSLDVE